MDKKKRLVFGLFICMVIVVCGIYILNSDLLVEKVYGKTEWKADALLVFRTGTDRGTLISNPMEIADIQKSYKWTNFHIECCVGAPDFRVYVYQDGEPVSVWHGFNEPNNEAYNRDFAQRISELGKRPPNVWVSEVTVPSGVYTEDIAATLGHNVILPLRSEEHDARGPYLIATYKAFFDRNSAMGEAAGKDSPLGEFSGDDIFIPLQEALIQEGVLRRTSSVDCNKWYGSSFGVDSYAERSITFYLERQPSFNEFGSLTLEYSDGDGWKGFIVTETSLNESTREMIQEMGITIGSK